MNLFEIPRALPRKKEQSTTVEGTRRTGLPATPAAELHREMLPTYSESWIEATTLALDTLKSSNILHHLRSHLALLHRDLTTYTDTVKNNQLAGQIDLPIHFNYAPLPFTVDDLRAALESQPPHPLAHVVINLYTDIAKNISQGEHTFYNLLELCENMRRLYECVWVIVTPNRVALNNLKARGYDYQRVELMFEKLLTDIRQLQGVIEASLQRSPPDITPEIYLELIVYLRKFVQELVDTDHFYPTDTLVPEFTQYEHVLPSIHDIEVTMTPLMTRTLVYKIMEEANAAIPTTCDDFLVARGVQTIYRESLQPVLFNLVIDALLGSTESTQRAVKIVTTNSKNRVVQPRGNLTS